MGVAEGAGLVGAALGSSEGMSVFNSSRVVGGSVAAVGLREGNSVGMAEGRAVGGGRGTSVDGGIVMKTPGGTEGAAVVGEYVYRCRK